MPPLLAACPGQVVQGVVYAQLACVSSQCDLLRDNWLFGRETHSLGTITEVTISFL